MAAVAVAAAAIALSSSRGRSSSTMLRRLLYATVRRLTISSSSPIATAAAGVGGSSMPSRPVSTPSIFCYQSRRPLSLKSNTNNPAAFNFSDDSDDENERGGMKKSGKGETAERSKLPPPYDPFSKKPVVEEPEDPKNLQEIFHKMRTEGLVPNAIKMFDALSKDGLTHEALQLFSQIKDKGHMPDVVAHTAVIEAYANAGNSKEALKVFIRMLASGVQPNVYTYSVLIRGLSADTCLPDAQKYILEMMDKGMRPNVATYTALFEAFVRENKIDEGRAFLDQMKAKGFSPDEKAVREHLAKRGPVFRSIMNLLFNK